jgi:hypothetical protein
VSSSSFIQTRAEDEHLQRTESQQTRKNRASDNEQLYSSLRLLLRPPAFAAAYGAANPEFDIFGGNLSANGETPTLNNSTTMYT